MIVISSSSTLVEIGNFGNERLPRKLDSLPDARKRERESVYIYTFTTYINVQTLISIGRWIYTRGESGTKEGETRVRPCLLSLVRFERSINEWSNENIFSLATIFWPTSFFLFLFLFFSFSNTKERERFRSLDRQPTKRRSCL